MTSLWIVGIAACGHVALSQLVRDPWLVPDLLLIGMLLARVGRPASDLRPAWLGAVLAMLAAGRGAMVVGLAYLSAGWLMERMAVHWNVEGRVGEVVSLAIGEAWLLVVWCGLDARMTPGLVGLAGVRLLLTVGVFAVIRWLMAVREARASSHISVRR